MHIAGSCIEPTLEGVRLRLPELLEEKGLTAYHLAKQSGGRISLSAAYRYVRLNGRIASFDSEVLEAMCDVLNVEPGELLERDRRGRKGR
jgi:DNA-binding Xre family transcriptional regulator